MFNRNPSMNRVTGGYCCPVSKIVHSRQIFFFVKQFLDWTIAPLYKHWAPSTPSHQQPDIRQDDQHSMQATMKTTNEKCAEQGDNCATPERGHSNLRHLTHMSSAKDIRGHIPGHCQPGRQQHLQSDQPSRLQPTSLESLPGFTDKSEALISPIRSAKVVRLPCPRPEPAWRTT